MSKASFQIGIKGIDQTGAAFKSIQSRARVTSANIRAMVGGAVAAAGTYLSFRSVASGVEELGRLSDLALKANTSVDELTKTSQALGILGIQGAGVNELAKAFSDMEKNSGKSGLRGFFESLEAIGKIPDQAQKAKEAVRVFGDRGMDFMPLINAAAETTSALQGVIGAMAGVPQAAANAGDDVVDGAQIVSNKFKGLWLEAIGKVAKAVTGIMPESFRQGCAIMMAYADYYARNIGNILAGTWQRIIKYPKIIGSVLGAEYGALKEWIFGTGGTWEDVKDVIYEGWTSAWDEYDTDIEEIESRIAARAEKLKKDLEDASVLQKNYDNATAGASGGASAPRSVGEAIGNAFAEKAKKIMNTLIMGESNQARKLAMFGPEYQNEAKKQTRYLKELVDIERGKGDGATLKIATANLS